MKVLFVYGTLKRGGYNHHWLGEAKFLKKATVKGRLLVNGIPYLFHGRNTIKGELYKVQNDVFEAVKAMEERAGYYTSYEEVSNYMAYVFRVHDRYWDDLAEYLDEATEFKV